MTDEALATLYTTYGHLVLKRCERLVGPSDAEDALHDVFLKVSRGAPPAGRSTLIWLYRVTTNCCYDWLRSRRRSSAQVELLKPQVETAQVNDGDRRALLSLVLRKVDPQACELGLLHHVDGLTQDEIALEAGLSRKTVGRKLKRFDEEFTTKWLEAGGT